MTDFLSENNRSKIDEKIRFERVQRYAMQSAAKLALPGERVGVCLRNRVGEFVGVMKHKETKKTFYNGLMVCGSVWACPVCAAKISEKRRLELEKAFKQHQDNGGKIAMLTLTFSHKKTDKLKDILDKFGAATQKMMTGRAYHEIRLEMGIIGRVRSMEVTYGFNGFHPHGHIAIFYENETDLKKMKNRMYELWEKACSKVGLKVNKKYGLDLQSGEQAQDYLAKHGTWSLEQEMSKAHIKVAKNDSMTPFDFLRLYIIENDDKYLWLFKEYFLCFKGKRQLQWSQGLKQMFALDEKTDEELASEKIEEADLLGNLNIDEWKLILRHEQRAQLLSEIESLGYYKGLERIMERIRIKEESSLQEDSKG